MSISGYLPMTSVSRLGTCRRCMRTSFAFAAGSIAILAGARLLLGPSVAVTLLGFVAAGFSLLWLSHLTAFGWRRSTAGRGTVVPAQRRRFVVDFATAFGLAALAAALPRHSALAQSCIGQGQTCTLNGTPCCAGYSCQGQFPNTTCQ